MSELRLIYRTLKQAVPPRPIRLERPGWAGDPNQKRADGGIAQPWHCVPFVEGATYGLELVYPHATECIVTAGGADGLATFQFDWNAEPGLQGDEFSAFAPGHYGFASGLDIQCPPGFELRIEPHPRFFADNTGTAPLPVIGNLQTEWWPMFFFVVFKSPPPGQHHIFRKGEPYAQVCIVPHKPAYVLEAMSGAERAKRDALHTSLVLFSQYAARGAWHSAHGTTFDDRYRVLAHAFKEGGYAGVTKALNEAGAAHGARLGDDVPLEAAMQAALGHHQANRLEAAESIYRQVLLRDPGHAEALHLLGVIAHQSGNSAFGATLIRRAMSLAPGVSTHHNNLAVCLRATGQLEEAERVLTEAIARHPRTASLWINLGDLQLAQGRGDDAVVAWRHVIALAPAEPAAHVQFASVLTQLGRTDEARVELSRALELQPDFPEARDALAALNSPKEPST